MTSQIGKALLRKETSFLDRKFSSNRQPGLRRSSIVRFNNLVVPAAVNTSTSNNASQEAYPANVSSTLEKGVLEKIVENEDQHTEYRSEIPTPQDQENVLKEGKRQQIKNRICLDVFSLLRTVELIFKIHYYRLFCVAFGSSGITATVMYSFDEKHKIILENLTTCIVIMGGFISFALVFRTNTCYDRWWEARSAWGKLVYATIHCAQQGKCWINDDELSSRFLAINIVFAYASKALLRGNSLSSEEEEGPHLVSSGLIQQEELNFIHNQAGWEPYYCIDVMRAITNQAWSHTKNGCTLEDPSARVAAYKALEDSIRDLATSIGPCIKVKATGLPLSYDTFMRIVIDVFSMGASLAFSSTLFWSTPVVICIMFFFMELVIVIGDSMQEPFGKHFSSLPLQKYCAIIEDQLAAIEERHAMSSCFSSGNFAGLKSNAEPSNDRGKFKTAILSCRRSSLIQPDFD